MISRWADVPELAVLEDTSNNEERTARKDSPLSCANRSFHLEFERQANTDTILVGCVKD